MKVYACLDCGSSYDTHLECCCPECGSGIINQYCISPKKPFESTKPHHLSNQSYKYRSDRKATGLAMEWINHTPAEYTFIDDYEQSPVIIDYLCFTVSLKDFRHCKKESPYSGFFFPTEPKFDSFVAKSFDDIEAYNKYYRAMYMDYLQETVRRFIQYVLGFNYGAIRGKGFQFYEDSFILTSAYGDDFCGQVGFGGNNDTIHFQINGHGCKHLFANRSCAFVHHWLRVVLGVQYLTRVDLAFDDYDNLHTCEAAERACIAGGFKRSRGFSPKVKICDEYSYDADGNKVFTREERNFGSRQSRVYWRVYNKKLEQNIQSEDFHWYRSEVELKKWDVDILLNPLAAFVGINPYAASLISEEVTPMVTKTKGKKRAACDLLSATYWAKRQYGRLVNSLLNYYDNDFEKVVSSLARDGTVFAFPSMHQKLVNALE
ncbi:TPA: replication initiation factor domain-containing protein [Vibrio cholerae]